MNRPNSFHMWYVKDAERYRVGRSDWSNDTFNIYTRDPFDIISDVCEMMSIPLIDITDEE